MSYQLGNLSQVCVISFVQHASANWVPAFLLFMALDGRACGMPLI